MLFKCLGHRKSKLTFPSPEHMKQLYAVCKAKRKVWKEMPNGTHNETVAEPYFFNYIFEFMIEELRTS